MDRLSFQISEQFDYLRHTVSPYFHSGSRAARNVFNSAYTQLTGSGNADIPFSTWISWQWSWFCEQCGSINNYMFRFWAEFADSTGSAVRSIERKLSYSVIYQYISTSVDRSHICFLAAGLGAGLLIGIQLRKNGILRPQIRMRAVVCNSYRGADSISVVQDQPAPSSCLPDEVVIQVKASTLDPMDLRICTGYGRVIRRQYHKANGKESFFPFVLGRECSGRIVEIGSRVAASEILDVGDEVYSAVPYYACGAASELVAVPAEWVARKPQRLSYEAAAALPYSACIAWNALVHQAGLNKLNTVGKRILIVSADNAVGCMIGQLAKLWGAHVTAMVSSKALPALKKLEMADELIIHDGSRDYLTLLANSANKFDLVLNTVGSFLHEPCRSLVTEGGDIVSTVASPPASDRYGLFLGSLYAGYLRIKLAFKGSVCGSAIISRSILEEIRILADAGHIQPVIDRVFDVDEAEQAGHYATTLGKIVIRFR